MRFGLLASITVGSSLVFALPALAEDDAFGVGSGADGSIVVTSPMVVNDCVELVANTSGPLLSTGATNGKFGPGDLVAIYTATGKTPVPTTLPEIQQPLMFQGTQLGHLELGRIASVTPTSITLTKPLVVGVSAKVTQIVRVPEYSTVDISGAGVIQAPPWDGLSGGIVAFLASGSVHVGGLGIDASGRGFRGGVATSGQTSPGDSTSLDADPSANLENARKGEGFGLDVFGPLFIGRGNRLNGGGGGNSFHAGGGGGANGGKGGLGGNATSGAIVGGFGGVSLEYDLATQLLFGGGGGAGHATTASSTDGGAGGGVVLVRAALMQIEGPIRANGATPPLATAAGGGGGGAGGNVALRVSSDLACGPGALIQARGAYGGKVSALEGPGGGGAGGRILLQAEAIGATCVPDVDGGFQGTNIAGMVNGAAPGTSGAFKKLPSGFCGVDGDCPTGELCDFDLDTCDPSADLDADGVLNVDDNCPHDENPTQEDTDMDGVGDACEPPVEPMADADGDGEPDASDNCPATPNADQADSDGDGIGDACEPVVGCTSDPECGDDVSGMICVDSQCVRGCRGASGNGCPADQICSSADASPGTCSPSETTSSSATGGGDPDGITVHGSGVACVMSASSERAPLAEALVALGVALALVRRRRRADGAELVSPGSRPTLPASLAKETRSR